MFHFYLFPASDFKFFKFSGDEPRLGGGGTWIEPMVVINSQPWGIGHWFVFKRVCVHCIGMNESY